MDSLLITYIFQGCKLPPDAEREDFNKISLSNISSTGVLKKARTDFRSETAVETSIFIFLRLSPPETISSPILRKPCKPSGTQAIQDEQYVGSMEAIYDDKA